MDSFQLQKLKKQFLLHQLLLHQVKFRTLFRTRTTSRPNVRESSKTELNLPRITLNMKEIRTLTKRSLYPTFIKVFFTGIKGIFKKLEELKSLIKAER
jgi:hypothetical protein